MSATHDPEIAAVLEWIGGADGLFNVERHPTGVRAVGLQRRDWNCHRRRRRGGEPTDLDRLGPLGGGAHRPAGPTHSASRPPPTRQKELPEQRCACGAGSCRCVPERDARFTAPVALPSMWSVCGLDVVWRLDEPTQVTTKIARDLRIHLSRVGEI